MPKLIRENPAYFIVPIFVLIIGAVFFFAEKGGQAKEWERLASPAGFTQGRLSGITAYYDTSSNRLMLWAMGGGYIGGVSHPSGMPDVAAILSYDSLSGDWKGLQANNSGLINAVSNYDPLSKYTYAVGDQGTILMKVSLTSEWQIYHEYNNGSGWFLDPLNGDMSYATPIPVENDNLTDVSFYSSGDSSNFSVNAWATGYNYQTKKGNIFKTTSSLGIKWVNDLSNVGFPLLGLQMIKEGTSWAVGANHTIYKYSGGAWTEYTATDLSSLNFDSCTESGNNDFCSGNPSWSCVAGSALATEDCIIDFEDVYFTDNSHGWIPISSKKYLYYNGASWQIRSTLRPGSEPEVKMHAVAGGLDNNVPYIWFSGQAGMTIFAPNATEAVDHWLRQSTPNLDTGRLNNLFVLDSTHAWSAGYFNTAGQLLSDNIVLKLSSGNTAGYAYIGADNCENTCIDSVAGGACQTDPSAINCPSSGLPRQAPLGWVSFNCVNNGSCESNPFIYGVDLKKETETTDPNDSCVNKDPDPSFQDKDVGALSGQAWLGVTDPDERSDDTCALDVCSNNNQKSCDDDDDCALCGNNPASCFSPGWLSFDRNETSNPPSSPYIATMSPFYTPCGKPITVFDYEKYAMAFFSYEDYAVRGWGKFKLGQCSGNLSKSCYKDGDCESGDTCRFDFNGIHYCSLDSSLRCSTSAECAAQGKGICDQTAQGWLKLRGGKNYSLDSPNGEPPPITAPTNRYIYHNCNACTLVDPNLVTAYMTCKICDGLNIDGTAANYACNKCGEGSNRCGDGRCDNNTLKVCVQNSNSSLDSCKPGGTCQPSGYCSAGSGALAYKPCAAKNGHCGTDGICQRGYCSAGSSNRYNPCYNDEDCPSGSSSGYCEIKNPVTCNQCASCDAYGVSVDINAGNFYGYAWSEDFGWVDMSRVTLGGAAWLQTLFGDIYGQQGVGSTKTAKAPCAANTYNATYLILAGEAGKIVNFCTESISSSAEGESNRLVPSVGQPQSTANPWLVEQYRKFTLPNASLPNSILGRVDYNNMKKDCGALGTYYDGDLTLIGGTYFDIANGLAGKTYCVRKAEGHNGDFTISIPLTFNNAKNTVTDGSGLFVVDGNLNIQNNIKYMDNEAAITNLKKLASVAFYVKGDIYISPTVDTLVGTYYAEGKIITQSMGSADKKLTVYGTMIAREFDLGRRYKGTISNPQPSELFIYDGRVQLNPPPGFRDLSQSLPKITDVSL
ncbi:MAG: hypothetical protein WC528_01150 [Patescibacteria group bacterium]